MKTFVCEICGDAYLGTDAPSKCPFCGANKNFIKPGYQAVPIFMRKEEIGEVSRKNLLETLELEVNANAIYLCMAKMANSYEIEKMYKRLAKIELEHAIIVAKLLGIAMPENLEGQCSDNNAENFEKTIELEEHASDLYENFAKKATEEKIKIFFTALMKVETEHIALIRNYLK